MPATRCQVTFLLAATCGLLLHAVPAVGGDFNTELEEALNGDDEVHLLQERVVEKRRSMKPTDVEAAVEQMAKAPSVCQDAPAIMDEKAPAERDTYVDMAQLMEDESVAAPKAKPIGLQASTSENADSEGITDTVKTYTQIFRYAMDMLIVLVLLDGCRRWRAGSQNAAEHSEETPQGGTKEFQQLMRAVAVGDEAKARELLGQGASASEVDFWGCSALHAAAKGGMCGLATELLDLGAELDAADAWDDTPLHMASRAGHTEVCELLITRGASVDMVNAQSRTPLVVAGHAEHGAVCHLLLGKGANVGGLPEKELPPLLRELWPHAEEDTPTTVAPEEEELHQLPTEEDWEESGINDAGL